MNNIHTIQPLLAVNDIYENGVNNIVFRYTFGLFGEVLRRSKRYSTTVPPDIFKLNFNQLKIHMIGFYLAREIFVDKGTINRTPYDKSNYSFIVDVDDIVDFVYDYQDK